MEMILLLLFPVIHITTFTIVIRLPAGIHNIMGSDDIGGTVRKHGRSSKPSRIVHPFVLLGDGQ